MLTPAQEQALQAQMLATGAGGAPPPVATTALPTPTPGEIFPSVTTSMPIAPGTTSSWTAKKEGAEAEEKRRAADTADKASVDALKAATLGTTEAPTAPPKVAEVPTAAPTGEGLGGGIQQGATLPEQKQINALAIAAKQKEFEDAKQKALAEREQKRTAAMKGFNDEIASVRAEYAKTAAEPTQDNSWTSRLLRGLAAGLGAYGAAITHSPNYAQQILDAQVNQAIELKRDKMRQLESRLEKLGAKPEAIDKTIDREWALTLGQLQANLDRVKTAADVTLARFPQAQLEANKMIAEKQAVVAGEAAKRSATVGERTFGGGTNTPAGMVQTVQPGADKMAGSNKPTESEAKLSLLGKSMQDELKAIRNGVKLTSSDLDQLQKDTLGSEAADKAAEGGQAANFGVAAGRLVGLTPKSRYSNLPGEKQKTANAWDNAVEKYARVLTGAGMPAEEARRMARQNIPVAGDTPEVIEMKLQRLENEASRFVALSGSATEKRLASAPASQAPVQAAPAAPLSKATLAKQYMEAKRVKPGDPDYDEAQAFVKKAAKALGGK